jgi:hypothetical protein
MRRCSYLHHQLQTLDGEDLRLQKLVADAYKSGRNAALITLKLPDSVPPETLFRKLEEILNTAFLLEPV